MDYLENIDIHIDMGFLEKVDIDMGILQNINIAEMLYR